MVSYDCTACGLSYQRIADAGQFAGVRNLGAKREDVVIFSGQYLHCGQSLQHTASGWVEFDSPVPGGDEPWATGNVCLEVRVLECPCGFQLIIPDCPPA
ncbi:MAG: hypothetical protein ABWY04_11630 [Arthrobacter sp.]